MDEQFTVTVHKTNTDPIVFTEAVRVEVSDINVLITQQRWTDDLGEREATCSIRRSVVTRVVIDIAERVTEATAPSRAPSEETT